MGPILQVEEAPGHLRFRGFFCVKKQGCEGQVLNLKSGSLITFKRASA